jgi:hypothetical protein
MTLYIAKNDQKLGPYTIAEAQSLVTVGTIQATDWAWYEGLADWIPLNQVPGFAVTAAPAAPVPVAVAEAPAPRAKRPVLVWVLSILFFIFTPFALLSLVMTLLMASGGIPVPEAQRPLIQSQSYFDYGVTIFNDVMIPIWAVLFFLLKRQSLYLYLGMFVLSVIAVIYGIIAEDMVAKLGVIGLVFLAICWVLNLALLYYNWHLFRKGILR